MTDVTVERIDLKTTPVREERIAELRRLFPEVFTEGKIDFEALRRSLGDTVETAARGALRPPLAGQERLTDGDQPAKRRHARAATR